MIRGSERRRRPALLLTVACAGLLAGCPGRRPAPPAQPPATRVRTAAAVPTPTHTPAVQATATAAPSDAPPAPLDSLPAGASATLRTAARMTERARADIAAGRVDDALQLLEQAMQVEADAPFAYFYMAELYLDRGRAAEAEVLAQRAATLSHGYPAGWAGHAHALRGRALESLGDGARAGEAYRASLAADPGNTAAREGMRRLGAAR